MDFRFQHSKVPYISGAASALADVVADAIGFAAADHTVHVGRDLLVSEVQEGFGL
jgi:hypothetical protein